MEIKLLNTKGEDVGKVVLRDEVFGLKPKKGLIHEFATVYLANQRLGTAHTKTRAEVSGGGRKPWKQKHTGRARAGTIRSPLWRHGGITHGPRRHDTHVSIPRRKAKLALAHALSARAQEGGLVCVDGVACEDGKTKSMAALLGNLQCSGRVLMVVEAPNEKLARAGRNIPGFEMALPGDLNAYSVLRARKLIVTQPALEKLMGRWHPSNIPDGAMPSIGIKG